MTTPKGIEGAIKRAEETKEIADKIYDVGFRNGQIDMKNKVLKKINRDWSLVTIKKPMDLVVKILKKVNRISVKEIIK